MRRKIIRIDDEKCNGCGLCIPDCPEGALQLIDGKARLVSDLFCDGLGACIGRCPEGAIDVEEREAEPYNESKVMENIVKQGRNTILAHLDHLRSHNETEYLNEAIAYIKAHDIDMSPDGSGSGELKPLVLPGLKVVRQMVDPHTGGSCPGSRAVDFRMAGKTDEVTGSGMPGATVTHSELRHWPVQLHLLNPAASFLRGADVVLAADCVAFAMGDFHRRLLRGKSLAIACPKLDSNQQSYLEKITAMISEAKINTLTVVMMEVPCCGGLLRLAMTAVAHSGIKIPVKKIVVSIKGDILQEGWI